MYQQVISSAREELARGLKTTSWPKLKYHEQQARVWRSKARYINLACGRGSGKSELARRKIVVSLATRSNGMYFYALPTFMQAKRVAWTEILKLIPSDWILEKNVMNLYIRTIFGSELYIVGLDRPERLEGSQYDGGVIDECSDQKPGIFDRSIEPALSHRDGWCWRIGVPKRVGTGAVDFKNAFDLGLTDNSFGIESYTWASSTVLPPEKLEAIRKRLDPADYEEQYEANWLKAGGLIYYTFSLADNVKECNYDTTKRLYIGMDFNVNPMCWVLGHYENNILYIFDELFIRNTNTPECLNELARRYGEHLAGFYFYGDAASRQRRTSANSSDYVIVNNFNLRNKQISIPNRNPAIRDRYASVNAIIKNANKECRLVVSPRCRKLIYDLSNFAYKPGSSIPDTSNPDMGHISDALGYLIWQIAPIEVESESTPEVGIFAFN